MKNDPASAPEACVTLEDKLNLETARICWTELQPYFARGHCIYVAPGLDLIHIAHLMAKDETSSLLPLIQQGQLGRVSDEQARLFYQQNQSMWAVVVAPFVLVQPIYTQLDIIQ
ncbi:DUF2288 domain-containing protein [Neisseriaceae bacterium ESL0693]|nr:DUF2288 domain-containing protein [Neisseriaceae bacterium ESL0693]